jgi:MauM/NapG family ferredoxin protein
MWKLKTMQQKNLPSGRAWSRKHHSTQLLRILSQSVFFGLFLYLLLGTHVSGQETIGAVERFFHFDPLLGLATFIASRTFFKAFLLAFVTIAVTVLFGRYVCGWACPLGAVLHFFSFLFRKLKWRKPRLEPNKHLAWKYLILIFVLVGSLFTLDFAGFLDPLSFLYRSFATAVLPAFSGAAGAGATALRQVGLPSTGDGWARFVQNLTINATFRQGLIIGVIFLGVVLLNAVRPRFWCRFLCPAGALLGLLARWNLVKLKIDADRCNGCRLCTLNCQAQASPYPNDKWNRAECMYCYACASECPHEAISFPLGLAPAKPQLVDLSRRKVIFTSTLSLLTVPLFNVSGSERPSEKLIRPPGALPEPQFLAKCIKCGACMKVCPTNGLQHASSEAGFLGIWTPVLVPRIGYCEYYCSLCTQVCPTGAIKELTVKEKTETKIGSAWIKQHRCLPYALGEPCRICEQRCPTSPKAILLVDSEFIVPGEKIPIQVPRVDPTLCNGCGVCETKCPVLDEPAIYCTSYGESRSEKNLSIPQFGK